MEINVVVMGNVWVLKLRGSVKLGPEVDLVRANLDELVRAGHNRLVLDLTGVPMVDSSGIDLMVRTLVAAKQQGGGVKLVNASPMVLNTLKIVGLLKMFEIYDSDAKAAAAYA